MRLERVRVSTSRRMSVPASVRRRWSLDDGGEVDVIDLGFAALTLPVGQAGRVLDHILPADDHYAAAKTDDDPEVTTK